MTGCVSPANIFQVPVTSHSYRSVTRRDRDRKVTSFSQAQRTHVWVADLQMCRTIVTMWQRRQQPYDVTGVSMKWHRNIRYIAWHWFMNMSMSLSHRCGRIKLRLFHKPNRFTTEHSHPGRRRTCSVVNQSPWGSTGSQPYHANGTVTSPISLRCNRHKCATFITAVRDCNFRLR